MLKSPRGVPTSHDIAELAGVSQPTVSKALRGCKTINADTRARVLAAAKSLNYTVNRNAARLRSKRTNTIALVVLCRPDDRRAAVNPFYLDLVGSIAAAASDAGFDLLVSFQDETQDFYGQYEDGRQADGLLVIGSAENVRGWSYFRALSAAGKAVICWGAPSEELAPEESLSVGADNRMGGEIATRHLIDMGRNAIIFVGPTGTTQRQFDDRYSGYCTAMRAAGLEPLPPLHIPAATREEQGAAAIANLLNNATPFDGLFAACDLIGIGALSALRSAGVDVPGTVSLVGFDGINASAYCSPAMTTIEQDFDVAGQYLVNQLICVIDDKPRSALRVPVRIVVRGSSGNNNAA